MDYFRQINVIRAFLHSPKCMYVLVKEERIYYSIQCNYFGNCIYFYTLCTFYASIIFKFFIGA